MNFQIRECNIEDAKDIYLLNRDSLGYDYPLELMKIKLRKILNSCKDKLFVAVVGNSVAGYVHLSDYDVIYADHMKNIMGIAVSGEYRKNGIGRALLFEAEKWAKNTGASGVRLCSGSQRADAHIFYEHCGYENCKSQINFKKMF